MPWVGALSLGLPGGRVVAAFLEGLLDKRGRPGPLWAITLGITGVSSLFELEGLFKGDIKALVVVALESWLLSLEVLCNGVDGLDANTVGVLCKKTTNNLNCFKKVFPF